MHRNVLLSFMCTSSCILLHVVHPTFFVLLLCHTSIFQTFVSSTLYLLTLGSPCFSSSPSIHYPVHSLLSTSLSLSLLPTNLNLYIAIHISSPCFLHSLLLALVIRSKMYIALSSSHFAVFHTQMASFTMHHHRRRHCNVPFANSFSSFSSSSPSSPHTTFIQFKLLVDTLFFFHSYVFLPLRSIQLSHANLHFFFFFPSSSILRILSSIELVFYHFTSLALSTQIVN